MFLSGPLLGAQVPWVVSLTAAVDPLPIGGCSNVYISVKDSPDKDAPRNRLGMRVSIADFDMVASSPDPNVVVGIWDNPNAWAVCSGQGSKIGMP